MPPERGEPRGSLPIATAALILAQVTAWVVVRRFLLPGNQWTDLAVQPGLPNETAFLIAPFIHLEPAHLGINLAVLWLFGTNVERAVGSFRFLLLYLGAGWFGSLMHWATTMSFHLPANLAERDAAVGSSGAVAGILAISTVRFAQPRLRVPLIPGWRFPATPIIVLWLLYTVVRALLTTLAGVGEGIGHWAHFAGFIFGLGAGQLLGFQRAGRREYFRDLAQRATAQHNLPAAGPAWSAVLAMCPDDAEAREALIQVRLAQGDGPGARRLAREGIEAAVRADDRERALAAYRTLHDAVPELDLSHGVRYRIGCWLADAGEYPLAFQALWESAREDGATPSAAGALHRAGQIAWERMSSAGHAREAWERLLTQFPDSPWCDAARAGLRRLAEEE
jgi:membrane associated rhomboid family serine protease